MKTSFHPYMFHSSVVLACCCHVVFCCNLTLKHEWVIAGDLRCNVKCCCHAVFCCNLNLKTWVSDSWRAVAQFLCCCHVLFCCYLFFTYVALRTLVNNCQRQGYIAFSTDTDLLMSMQIYNFHTAQIHPREVSWNAYDLHSLYALRWCHRVCP